MYVMITTVNYPKLLHIVPGFSLFLKGTEPFLRSHVQYPSWMLKTSAVPSWKEMYLSWILKTIAIYKNMPGTGTVLYIYILFQVGEI